LLSGVSKRVAPWVQWLRFVNDMSDQVVNFAISILPKCTGMDRGGIVDALMVYSWLQLGPTVVERRHLKICFQGQLCSVTKVDPSP
jgi:hypothetical protein